MIGQAFSHYRIRDQLGIGGMGVVYRAEDVTLGREVAIKLLPTVAKNRQMVERFLGEARAAAALNHPNICTIYEAGEQDGQPYIAMELLEGQTLQQYLAAGQPSVARVLDIATQIASGLDAAHAKGIIHRDIKPANVYVAHDGRIKILDFGLAKLKRGLDIVGQSPEEADTVTFAPAEQPTGQGALVGTVAYMSPEQARGEPLDTRTDLFSFGVVLYEMCTGRCPFAGATWAVIVNGILSETPLQPSSLVSDIPPELDAIIGKALTKDREHRYRRGRGDSGRPPQSGARHSVRACVRTATRGRLAVRVGHSRGAQAIDRPPCGDIAGNSGLSGAVCRLRRSIPQCAALCMARGQRAGCQHRRGGVDRSRGAIAQPSRSGGSQRLRAPAWGLRFG